MIEKKKIERIPVLPAMAEGREQYIGRVRMHKETIVMDVYDARHVMCPVGEEKRAEIGFRWVCDGKNFYTYMFRSRRWTTGGLHYAMRGRGVYYDHLDIRLDEESERIAEEFLEGCKCEISPYYTRTQADRLQGLEVLLMSQRSESREQRRWDRIEARQKKRAPLPKDWEKWLDTNVFREERYIFYTTKKSGAGICAHCGNTVSLEKAVKHNAPGKCAACGSRIHYKAIGRIREVRDKKPVVYLQQTDGGFLVRYFTAVKVSNPDGERYRTMEGAMDTRIGAKVWRDYCKISGVNGEEFWDDRRPGDMSLWNPEGYLYTRNVKNVLKKTLFRYAPLAEWMKHEKGALPIGDFLTEYLSKPYLEFFIKAGLYKLTKECVVFPSPRILPGGGMKEVLGIDRQRTARLIRMDGGIRALEWLRYEERHGCKIPDETIRWLEDSQLYEMECEGILSAVQSVVRMVNYLKKQDGPMRSAAITWRDYLRMAQDEGMDITDDIVRFPKDLRTRHDQMVSRSEQQRQEKIRIEHQKHLEDLDRRICERFPEAERYAWGNEDYAIIPAAKCVELEEEGRALHHCVGRDDHYMKKMAAGTSWILFLRKKTEPDTPYYTIEIRMEDDEILQWYSSFDRQPDAQVIGEVLRAFKRSIKKRKRVCIPVRVSA